MLPFTDLQLLTFFIILPSFAVHSVRFMDEFRKRIENISHPQKEIILFQNCIFCNRFKHISLSHLRQNSSFKQCKLLFYEIRTMKWHKWKSKKFSWFSLCFCCCCCYPMLLSSVGCNFFSLPKKKFVWHLVWVSDIAYVYEYHIEIHSESKKKAKKGVEQ